jgi:NAD(P)-dependent dehydrogenase (short-subunit alcohol dehydrogenase family)
MPSVRPVALVTGGANGIGRAVARHLLAAGWRLGVVDLPGSGLRRTFSARTRDIVLVEGDVREQETAARAVAALVERFGRLDGLVSNAGIMIRKPLHRLATAEWHRVIDTNLAATFLFVRAAEKQLRKARGAIVTIASTRAQMSEPNTESYAASKGGLVALTHALAISLGPRVRVNCVTPAGSRPKITPRFAARTTRSTLPDASANLQTSPRSSLGCSRANAPALLRERISSSMAA